LHRFLTIEMFVVVFVRVTINQQHVLNRLSVRCLCVWMMDGIKFNLIYLILLDVLTEQIILKHFEFKFVEHWQVNSIYLLIDLDSCQLSYSTCLLLGSTLFRRWIAAGIQIIFTGNMHNSLRFQNLKSIVFRILGSKEIENKYLQSFS